MTLTATFHSTTKNYDCYTIDAPGLGKLYLPKRPNPPQTLTIEVKQ